MELLNDKCIEEQYSVSWRYDTDKYQEICHGSIILNALKELRKIYDSLRSDDYVSVLKEFTRSDISVKYFGSDMKWRCISQTCFDYEMDREITTERIDIFMTKVE